MFIVYYWSVWSRQPCYLLAPPRGSPVQQTLQAATFLQASQAGQNEWRPYRYYNDPYLPAINVHDPFLE